MFTDGCSVCRFNLKLILGFRVAQSVQCLTTDWTTERWVRSLTEAEDFSSNVCVETCSEAHPASYPMGTRAPFPGCKARPVRDADHSPHLVPRSRMSRSYISPPQAPLWRVVGQLYFAFKLIFSLTSSVGELNPVRMLFSILLTEPQASSKSIISWFAAPLHAQFSSVSDECRISWSVSWGWKWVTLVETLCLHLVQSDFTEALCSILRCRNGGSSNGTCRNEFTSQCCNNFLCRS
jgi:hypothetical protein